MTTQTYAVTGMSCNGCAARVRQAALAVPGVHRAEVSLEKGQLRVEREGSDTQAVVHALEDIGFGAKYEA